MNEYRRYVLQQKWSIKISTSVSDKNNPICVRKSRYLHCSQYWSKKAYTAYAAQHPHQPKILQHSTPLPANKDAWSFPYTAHTQSHHEAGQRNPGHIARAPPWKSTPNVSRNHPDCSWQEQLQGRCHLYWNWGSIRFRFRGRQFVCCNFRRWGGLGVPRIGIWTRGRPVMVSIAMYIGPENRWGIYLAGGPVAKVRDSVC